jgi:hypothetical protein
LLVFPLVVEEDLTDCSAVKSSPLPMGPGISCTSRCVLSCVLAVAVPSAEVRVLERDFEKSIWLEESLESVSVGANPTATK